MTLVMFVGVLGLLHNANADETLGTGASVSNTSPVFTATPSDGGSAGGTGTDDTAGNPTAVGSNVTFTATAIDVNSDQYYLAACKTDAVTVGDDAAPTCDGGAWGISAAANSAAQASQTYTALVGDAESNAWYAFVCDKLATGSGPICYPANAAGDQGFAVGTMTFTDVPADEDDITIDSITYVFDTANDGTVKAGTEVDTSTSEDGADAAAALVAAEVGTSSHMTSRGAVTYIYADTEGAGGNSLGTVVNTCSNCTAGGATLAGGSADNMSPFKVNHEPTFGAVTFTDSGDGTIAPGDTVKFLMPNANWADSDTDGSQDTLNFYVCSGESDMGGVTSAFDYSTDSCTGGTLLCSSTGTAPSSDGTCNDTTDIVVVPTAHGTYDVKIYVEDNHSMPATGGTTIQTFTVIDVAPVLTSYTAVDAPAPAAGSSDPVDFSVAFTDDNGDGDVTAVEGVFFEDTTVANTCTADENDCYIDATCTLTLQSGAGSGKTATGTDNALGADCQVTVYFNATASANWEVQAKPTDGIGQETGFADSNVNLTNAALSGIDIAEASIAYGTVAIGGTSTGQETSMGNVGNQILDVLISGANMCTDYPTCSGSSIVAAQQKWHQTSATFDWDTAESNPGPWILKTTSSAGAETAGCTNRDIPVRLTNASTATNESVYWKIRIPSSQAAGSYTGANTFATTADSSCSGTLN